MNTASYNMYKHRISPNESFIQRALKRPETIPLIFFVTSLALWLAFLSKIYFESHQEDNAIEAISVTNDYQEPLSIQTVAYETISNDEALASYSDVSDNIDKINQLTEQLMLQQQKTDDLVRIVEQQKVELGGLIQEAIAKANTQDKNYIADLNQMDSQIDYQETDKTVLANTDYYNRVVISSSRANSSSLQNKINAFMSNDQTGSSYVAKLNTESEVRRNEIRSIALQEGESIWMIAKRAYGSGYLYYKIMRANPQINEENARHLAPGTIIRVPI